MNVKFDLNEVCPCGSTDFFENCCHRKALEFDKSTLTDYTLGRIQYETHKIWGSTDFEICLGFKKEECSDQIISSHSIQNNRILNKISQDNHVYTFKAKLTEENMLELSKISKNKASTFKGFCGYHDDALFSRIEKESLNLDIEQLFLFAFRAHAIEDHKKRRELSNHRELFKKFPFTTLNPMQVHAFKMAELSVKDNEKDYEQFRYLHDNHMYTKLISIVRELDYEVSFATTSSFAVQHDLNGNEINDIYGFQNDLPSVYLNIFPYEGKTKIIISYLDLFDNIYGNYFLQLDRLSIDELCKYLNFLTVNHTENIYFNPEFIEGLTMEQKSSLLESFQSSFLPIVTIDLISQDNYFKFNLFK